MKYWELLGLGSEPKGTGKIMSICMFIVIINGYFLEGFMRSLYTRHNSFHLYRCVFNTTRVQFIE